MLSLILSLQISFSPPAEQCPPAPKIDLTNITNEAFFELTAIKDSLNLLKSNSPLDQINGRDLLLQTISSEPLRSASIDLRKNLVSKLSEILTAHQKTENKEGSWSGRVYVNETLDFAKSWSENEPIPAIGNVLTLLISAQDRSRSMDPKSLGGDSKKLKMLSAMTLVSGESSKFASQGKLNDPKIQRTIEAEIREARPVKLTADGKKFLVVGAEYKDTSAIAYYALEVGRENEELWKVEYESSHRSGLIRLSQSKVQIESVEAQVSFLKEEKLRKNFKFSSPQNFHVSPVKPSEPAPNPGIQEISAESESPKK